MELTSTNNQKLMVKLQQHTLQMYKNILLSKYIHMQMASWTWPS